MIDRIAKAHQETRDEIGLNDSVIPVIKPAWKDDIECIELSTITSQTTTATDSFVLGHDTLGILGTSKLGAGSVGAETNIIRVLNPNNTFRDFFRDTQFRDGITTADWNVDTFEIIF